MEEDPQSRLAAECLVSLSPHVVAYTAEELELIRISKTNNEDGSKRRTTVYDIDGNAYTLPGQQRHDGDFTMPSGFRIYRQHWIRAKATGNTGFELLKRVRLRSSVEAGSS